MRKFSSNPTILNTIKTEITGSGKEQKIAAKKKNTIN